ncbi:MAG TPA: FAD-binding oxidoreductase [Armatimonadota bacterium]|jgi:D-lactate dehydrogenase (cytochrome)
MATDALLPMSSDYDGYLRDESRRCGEAASISFPRNEAEVIATLRQAADAGLAITTQGARTGIVAGAVPLGGHILNLERMKHIGVLTRDGEHASITVEPGALLTELRAALEAEDVFFPPDPTEASASLGGMVACNASGAMTYAYGPTRDWVQALRVVLPDGDVLALRRGARQAQGRTFCLTTEGGRDITGSLPDYTAPQVKSAAGYFVHDDMDLLDLFIGMEGTLGVITEIELRLIPRPAAIVGLTSFLPSEEAALAFVRRLRAEPLGDGIRPVAIEFFNSDALDLLRALRDHSTSFSSIPVLRPHYHTAIYTEFHGASEDILEEAVMQAIETVCELGGNDEDTWYATTARELAPQKAFRHAVPEAVNLLIDERKKAYPTLTKLGTDMSVPDAALEDAMAMYHDGLHEARLQSAIFGHIGNNHVHVNILPRDLAEYDQGKALYADWAQRVVAWGGSVAAEHGIGKLKVSFLRLMYGDESLAQMRALKGRFDPEERLNAGNWFA